MTNQIFNSVGVDYPAKFNSGPGAWVFPLTSSTLGATRVRGDVVRLISGTTDVSSNPLDFKAMGYIDFEDPVGWASNEVTREDQMSVYGCLLEDIADQATGLIMVRGYCAALCDALSTSINRDAALSVGGSANLNALVSARDMAVDESGKILALARNATLLNPAGGAILLPVLFNGAEGMGFFVGL